MPPSEFRAKLDAHCATVAAKRKSRPDVVESTTASGCTCPDCTGPQDPGELLETIFESASALAAEEDPLRVELLVVGFAQFQQFVPGADEVLVGSVIPAAEARADESALASLALIAQARQGKAGAAAAAATDRLVEAGMTKPAWAEPAEPVMAGDYRRLVDTDGEFAVFFGAFSLAGRRHAAVVEVDLVPCGHVVGIAFSDVSELDELVADCMTEFAAEGSQLREEKLDPAEFRWHLETVLATTADHDDDEQSVEELLAGEGCPTRFRRPFCGLGWRHCRNTGKNWPRTAITATMAKRR